MGMESYYITLEIDNLSSNNLRELFVQRYQVSAYKIRSSKFFRRYVVDDSRFVIDNKAVVTINTFQDLTNIIFELCFSNFDCNINYLYNVVLLISTLTEKVILTVMNEKYNFKEMSLDAFKEIIMSKYSNKYNLFTRKYGKIEKDILPNNFYSQINRFGCHK